MAIASGSDLYIIFSFVFFAVALIAKVLPMPIVALVSSTSSVTFVGVSGVSGVFGLLSHAETPTATAKSVIAETKKVNILINFDFLILTPLY